MKFTVTIKDPDALCDAASDAVEEELTKIEGLHDEEHDELLESRIEKVTDLVTQTWAQFGEVFRIEFDTDNMTARVLKKGE